VAARHLAKECQKRITRLPNKFEVCCGKGETHQEAADDIRQEPGCVAVRHFCDWLGATTRARQSPPYLESLQGFELGHKGSLGGTLASILQEEMKRLASEGTSDICKAKLQLKSTHPFSQK
jgi:hypothetical protein